MLEIKNPSWNTDDEDAQRVLLPANDCRRFNGGAVAPPEMRALWPDADDLETTSGNVFSPNFTIVIDRLRQ